MTDCKTIQNIQRLLLQPDYRAVAVHTASAEQFKLAIAGLFELSYVVDEDDKIKGVYYPEYMCYRIHVKGLFCSFIIEETDFSYEARAVCWEGKPIAETVRLLSFESKHLDKDLKNIDSLLTQFCGGLQSYLKSL